jgi:hypothetical protein
VTNEVFVDVGVLTEFVDGDELMFFLAIKFFDREQEIARSPGFTTHNVFDIFCVDDDATKVVVLSSHNSDLM